MNGGAIALGHPLGASGARLHDDVAIRARTVAADGTASRPCARAVDAGKRHDSQTPRVRALPRFWSLAAFLDVLHVRERSDAGTPELNGVGLLVSDRGPGRMERAGDTVLPRRNSRTPRSSKTRRFSTRRRAPHGRRSGTPRVDSGRSAQIELTFEAHGKRGVLEGARSRCRGSWPSSERRATAASDRRLDWQRRTPQRGESSCGEGSEQALGDTIQVVGIGACVQKDEAIVGVHDRDGHAGVIRASAGKATSP